MRRETLQQWAKRFVADLYVDGEALSFDGAIRQHREAIMCFRAERLKAKSILRAITQAGGRREDGQPYSEGQFRISVSRISREMASLAARNASTKGPQPRRRSAGETKPRLTKQQTSHDQSQRPSTPQRRPPGAASTRDISRDEIEAALLRLKKS